MRAQVLHGRAEHAAGGLHLLVVCLHKEGLHGRLWEEEGRANGQREDEGVEVKNAMQCVAFGLGSLHQRLSVCLCRSAITTKRARLDSTASSRATDGTSIAFRSQNSNPASESAIEMREVSTNPHARSAQSDTGAEVEGRSHAEGQQGPDADATE